MDPSTSTTNGLPPYEQAKVHTSSKSEPTAPPDSEAPPPYEETTQEEIVAPHVFPVRRVTVTSPPEPICSHCCNSVVCGQPESTNRAGKKSVKCASCKRREAEEMAECCGGLLENIIPNVSTIDAPPTYEQAKVHKGQKLKKGTTSPQAPPPYVDVRAYPGHLDFLQPVEVISPPNCRHCTIIQTQPGIEQGKPASKLVKCQRCQRRDDEEAERCEELKALLCASRPIPLLRFN